MGPRESLTSQPTQLTREATGLWETLFQSKTTKHWMWMTPKERHPKVSPDTQIYMGKHTQIRIYEAEDAYGRCSE